MRHHPIDKRIIENVGAKKNQCDDEKTHHLPEIVIQESLQEPQPKDQVNHGGQVHHPHVDHGKTTFAVISGNARHQP